jgi:pyruvate dehydrogenase E2 component (dihydrolipoamide acetyltransferase)
VAQPVIMPKQGQSVESCIISKWYKKKGDQIKIGDLLFNYETDKASFDEEAKVSGMLLEIFCEEGEDVPVFTNVCVIGTPGEKIDEFNPKKSNALSSELKADTPQQTEKDVKQDVKSIPDDGNIFISPRAKNLSEKMDIDYRLANPTGPYGRIIEQDIIALQQNGVISTSGAKGISKGQMVEGTGLGGRITVQDLGRGTITGTSAGLLPDYDEIKHSNIRKVIAKAMYTSLSTTAQLTLHSSFNATNILNYRKKLKEGKDSLGLENITINDIILYAVSRALLNHKTINAHYFDDKMLVFNNTHLGIAVDTERGLMVPTLFNANKKSLNEISKDSKKLVEGCQKGTISPDALKGGTFTITNLGALGIEMFTPVLNPPQVGILGVNTIVQRAKEVDGEIGFYPAMGLSLTFDHRAIDGAPAAKFLQELIINLENVSALIAK